MTGTDTGVGKTLVACGLLRAYAARGVTAVGMKPVATGIAPGVAGDVEQLVSAANVAAPRAEVNPYGFAPPIAPHIAADKAGKRLQASRLAGLCRGVMFGSADFVLIEGAGGWRVPLSQRETLADLAKELGVGVILVSSELNEVI